MSVKKFCLLLWKNYLLQKRRVIVTIAEIGIPSFFSLILVLIRLRVDPTYLKNPTQWSPFAIDRLPPTFNTLFNNSIQIAYTPNNLLTTPILGNVSEALGPNIKVKGFDTETAMQTYISDQMNLDSDSIKHILAGIVFTNTFPQDSTLPLTWSYELRLSFTPINDPNTKGGIRGPFADTRWNTELNYPKFQQLGPREKKDAKGGQPGYWREGFLPLQHAVDRAIICQHNSSAGCYGDQGQVIVEMKRMPYPRYNDDAFVLIIQQQFPLILILSFVLCALFIVKDIVHEKERKLKESMKMMGLPNWLHWMAWFVKYFLFLLISVILMTIFFCISTGSNGSVIEKTDPSVVFVFLVLYAVSTISFSFMISVFFSNANAGAAAGGIFFFISYIPYSFLQKDYESLSLAVKLVSCLISNVSMAFGGQVLGMFEGTGEGVQWSNIHKGATVDDSFSMLHVFVMLIADSILYGMVTWYIEGAFPGEYGVPKPFYFPFMKSYWFGSPRSPKVDDESQPLLSESTNHGSDYFEKEPVNLHAGIKIQGLSKKFSSGVLAVDNMSLNMYEGQITALLGHNGAGKTTTMSMLTGFIPPSSGMAHVNGYDIRTDIDKVRGSLGLCPQHDVLFDTLTVHEHLVFFAELKGYPQEMVAHEVSRMIDSIGLTDKTHAQARTLSGGMKRKLSVGIALIGDTKVVILDEPTSGMDPNARRHTWDILQRHRAGRTMVLTTHFMDEADLLGDRIAIMAKGVVQCCGSSLFLKNKYGAGYHMVIVKEARCNVEAVTNIVMQYVPGASLESNISAELSYRLPHESSSAFEALFTYLETNRDSLGIASFGASVTTMEEVFLRVGEDNNMGLNQNSAKKYLINTPAKMNGKNPVKSDTNNVCDGELGPSTRLPHISSSVLPMMATDKNTGSVLLAQQFVAMFYKRVLHTKRNIILSVCQLFVPLFFTVMALIVIQIRPNTTSSISLDLDLDKFMGSTVPYNYHSSATPNVAQDIAMHYGNMFGSNYNPVHVNDSINITEYFIEAGEKNFVKYTTKTLIGASLTSDSASAVNAISYFNNQAYHTPGITLNAMDNAILKYYTNDSHSIATHNHPLPKSIKDQASDPFGQGTEAFILSFNTNFGMAFLASSFVLFLIQERAVKSKHIQFVSGVHATTYWLSTFLWDIINYMIPCVFLVISFAIFSVDAYTVNTHWLAILFVFFLHGWAILPFMYLTSFMFKVPSTGLVWLTLFNILAGTATVLAVDIISIPELDLEALAKSLDWIFLVLLPHYSLGQSLEDFYINHQNIHICTELIPKAELEYACLIDPGFPCCLKTCTKNCFDYNTNYFGWSNNGVGRQLLFMTLQGVMYLALIFLIESGLIIKEWYKIRPSSHTTKVQVRPPQGLQRQTSYIEDDDVLAEKSRITQQTGISDSLVLNSLTKYYGNFIAVDDISVGISRGECFGLLGINGAGKTSTFKMMTGDETVSNGNAFLEGFDVRNNLTQVQRRLGYCPQFDALIGKMTGRETLQMYAKLRGVNKGQSKMVVQTLIDALLLTEHADKLAEQYSGGNKRKLSAAIALIGDPAVIFLDEPTTGMDPVARRLLWNTLSAIRDSGRTLVLTSHSMEECEALCTRLAIMVNGEFRCLGVTQHLKNKFGEGYTLIAKVKYPDDNNEPDLDPLMNFIIEKFPGALLKDVHQGQVHYHIPVSPETTWASVFGALERARNTYSIEDYSISQTTLEQVFINFAKSQRPPVKAKVSMCCC